MDVTVGLNIVICLRTEVVCRTEVEVNLSSDLDWELQSWEDLFPELRD